jgi:hypothetical protein
MAALGYFLAAGIVLFMGHGHYERTLILAFAAMHVAFSAAILFGRRDATVPRDKAAFDWREGALAATLLVFTVLDARTSGLLYARRSDDLTRFTEILRLLPIAAAAICASVQFHHRRVGRWVTLGCAAVVIAVCIYARAVVLRVSPEPQIDVWTSSQRAIDYFLHGHNPYAGRYDDIYSGRYDYPPGFPYWPGYLHWATLFAAILPGAHDVRSSLLIAEVLGAGCLAGLLRHLGVRWTTVAVFIAAWLAFPVAYFIIEQAWIDPLLVLCLAGAAWALARGKWILAGLLVGYACGTKQYVIITAALAAIYVYRAGGWKAALRYTAGGLASVVALIVPFCIADWTAFYNRTVRTVGDLLPRTDAFTIPAYFANENPPQSPEALKAVFFPFSILALLVCVAAAFWLWRRRSSEGGITIGDFFAANAVAYGFVFLFSKQAFCNYYYFAMFFVAGTMLTFEWAPALGKEVTSEETAPRERGGASDPAPTAPTAASSDPPPASDAPRGSAEMTAD